MLNKKGSVIDMVNYNSHIPTPVFMSNKGYGFVCELQQQVPRKDLFSNTVQGNMASTGRMEFGGLRNRFTTDAATLVDYVVVASTPGDYDTLQRRLSALTGRAPVPPEWSLGYIQSKLRYENQTEVVELAKEFKRRNIPVSLIGMTSRTPSLVRGHL